MPAVFTITTAATVAAGGTLSVPAYVGALGSLQAVHIQAGTTVITEAGTTGTVTGAAAGVCSLNGSRNFFFCGDTIPANAEIEVEAQPLGDQPTRSKAFPGLPGIQ
jgi:hypothetical protein